ncbi:hypothetical protein Tco_0319126 [Tanacetum coccineum]
MLSNHRLLLFLEHPTKSFWVVKALYGLHQAPRAWYETLSSFLLENGFRRAITPIESNKPLVKDEDGVECKKQTIMANSTTETEYVAAAHCCGQVLWIQNQMMDYGFNFINTKIHIDNERTICVVKNPVYHSRTKHIEIRHHFIRDCYEKRLIDVLKIHTDSNVADLLTKGFDVTSKLQIADATGIHNLSDAEIYDGLATLEYVTEGAAVDQGEGSAQLAEPHHTPVDPISSTSQPPISSPSHPSPPLP